MMKKYIPTNDTFLSGGEGVYKAKVDKDENGKTNSYTIIDINEEGEWVDVKKEQPSQFGWYRIKTIHGEYEAPFVGNASGFLQWVVLDESIITHWFKTYK